MGFIPSGIHHENMAGLEVVLASGDVVRTGQFAMDGSATAHLTHMSFGPSLDGLFLQSNLGIVTKLGLHLTPQPQAFMGCTFDMPEFDDIATITDVFGALRRSGVLNAHVCVFSLGEWVALQKKRYEIWPEGAGRGPVPEHRLREVQRELDIGAWNAKWGLCGPEAVVRAQYDEVARVLAREAPTGRLRGDMFAAGDGEAGRLDALSVPQPHGGMFVGVPSMFSIPMVDYYNPREGGGVGAHGSFAPIVPLDGNMMREWVRVARRVYEKHGMDLSCDFFMGHRHAVFVCMLCFDKTNPELRVAVDRIYEDLFEEATKMGFAKYRAHISHMGKSCLVFSYVEVLLS